MSDEKKTDHLKELSAVGVSIWLDDLTFSSIGWAATAALALSIPAIAGITGLMTLAILATTWKISPRRR